jgi:hypothetical protein
MHVPVVVVVPGILPRAVVMMVVMVMMVAVLVMIVRHASPMPNHPAPVKQTLPQLP